MEGDAKNVFAALNAIEEDFNIDGGLVDETNGSRLTAYELVHDNIPATVIAYSNLEDGKVNAVVVGADRVAPNGDTGNKIGTYTLVVSAKYRNIPFFVAASLNSVDFVKQ
ncbi:hypothetical protein ACLB2K_038149 [Fragaria x ananassa]